MTFRWIRDHRQELRGIADVGLICRTLGVSRPGYYAWAKRRVSGRDVRRRELLGQIRAAHASSRGTYGSPRIAVELKASGVRVCENTVARYMREHGLKVKPRRRFMPCTTDSAHPHPVAPNVLDRDFAAGGSGAVDGPDRKWCCDLTYVRTDEGWLYLWVVIDLFSRRDRVQHEPPRQLLRQRGGRELLRHVQE